MQAADPTSNLLLHMLPPAVHDRIREHLTPVSLYVGELLFDAESDAPIDAVYFLLDPIVSLDQIVGDKKSGTAATASVALTGREGVVGVEVFLGAHTAISRATVRVGGSALRMPADALRGEFARGSALQRLLLGAVDALTSQLANNSACERLHSPLQRLIRWLLLVDDRIAAGRELTLKQETLAQFLGVRRESVSLAAGELQRAGLISYSRSNLMVVDRAGLEARSCACYRAIKARYDAMFRAID